MYTVPNRAARAGRLRENVECSIPGRLAAYMEMQMITHHVDESRPQNLAHGFTFKMDIAVEQQGSKLLRSESRFCPHGRRNRMAGGGGGQVPPQYFANQKN